MTARPRKGLHTLEILSLWTLYPKETLRTWAKRGRIVPLACDVRSRSKLFDGAAVVQEVGINPNPKPGAASLTSDDEP